MNFSPKQIESFNQANKRLNIWVGAVRSGKTFSSTHAVIDFMKNGPPGDGMFIGVNRASIQRNVLGLLYKTLGFPEPSSKTNETKLYGRRIYFIGAPDESAVSSIQGATLAFAYVDEATCIPAPFWRMLLSRLSVPGARLFATCNPDGPAHWLKKEYIDRKDLDLISWNFVLDDNPSLDESYKENLKKEYTGMWYRRYILGEWALAHGAIYDTFDHDNIYDHSSSNPNYYIMGIDYGTTNATAAVLCAVTPNQWPQIRVEQQYYWDSAKQGRSKTDEELANDIVNFIGWKSVRSIYVDPAAASLKLALRRKDLPVLDANNDVLLGVKITAKFIAGKNLVIHRSCQTLIEQLQSYAWDPKAAERGEDKPIKKDDHLCVAGDTNVWIDGCERSIKDICERNDIFFPKKTRSYWNGKFDYFTVNAAKKTAINKKILKLTLENGKVLRATPDHQVWTKRGYIEIQNLMENDEVLCYDPLLKYAEGEKSYGTSISLR